MTTKFSGSHPPINPPAQCKSLKEDLPPLIPPGGPVEWQGYAEWHDYGATPPLHISMMVNLVQKPGGGEWAGEQIIDGVRFVMILTGSGPDTTWTILLEVWRSPAEMEDYEFLPFYIYTDPIWTTPLLTEPHPILQDWMRAGASA